MRWTHAPSESHAVSETRAHVGNEPGAEPGARFAVVKLTTDAKQALVQLGFTKLVARDAVAVALDRLGPTAALDRLIFEALRSIGGTS